MVFWEKPILVFYYNYCCNRENCTIELWNKKIEDKREREKYKS